MNEADLALVSAGTVGTVTAIVHGFVMQRQLIEPLLATPGVGQNMSRTALRLVGPLLRVSTLVWFVTGGLLIWAGLRATGEPRSVVGAAGAIVYGHAAIANAVAVRRLHPGWILMGLAAGLTIVGISGIA